ncbi:hypothetical protein BS78_05G154700, partial [Paspalum vaginatum]
KIYNKENFSLWQCMVTQVLVQQGYVDDLEGNGLEETCNKECTIMGQEAIITILQCLSDESVQTPNNGDAGGKMETRRFLI